ncbi:unnamed protein product [Mucor fragilis]
MHLLKSGLNEDTAEDKPQSTIGIHTKNSSIAKPKAKLNDDSPGKSTKEHTVPKSGFQADKTSADKKPKRDIANYSRKEAVHPSNTKPLRNQGAKQCNSSHVPLRQQPPAVLDSNDPSEAASSFQDAIVRTSTPNNSTRHSFIADDREISLINKETKRSRYFLRKSRNVSHMGQDGPISK